MNTAAPQSQYASFFNKFLEARIAHLELLGCLQKQPTLRECAPIADQDIAHELAKAHLELSQVRASYADTIQEVRRSLT
jgi:hypothetical protein